MDRIFLENAILCLFCKGNFSLNSFFFHIKRNKVFKCHFRMKDDEIWKIKRIENMERTSKKAFQIMKEVSNSMILVYFLIQEIEDPENSKLSISYVF